MDDLGDFTKPVSRPVRRLALAALICAVPVLLALVVCLGTLPLREPITDTADLAKLAGVVGFLVVLQVTAVWILARRLRRP